MRLKAIFLSLLMVLMAVPAHADTITIPNTFSAGTSAQASQVNANFTAVTTVVNGNIDNANIKAAAGIVPSKLSLISEYMNLQSTNNRGFSAGVTGDTVPRVALNSRGSLDFGPGSSTPMDLALIRSGSNTLKLRDQGDTADKNFTCGALTFSDTSAGTALLQVLRTTNNNCVAAGVTGDTNPRIALNSRGSLDLGGGSGALDLAIMREDADTAAIRDQGNSTYKGLKAGSLALTTPLPYTSGGLGFNTLGSAFQVVRVNAGATGLECATLSSTAALNTVCGRLTLSTGVPITTSNVTGATSVYFTPLNGNQIALYNGSSWELKTFSEVTLSLSGLTANLPYDIFIYDSSGVTGELVAWTSSSARATALATQDSVLVKTGATGRRYVGTILITSSTGQCEDSTSFRGVYNYYNQVPREFLAVDTTNSWTYGSTTTRASNGSTTLGTNNVAICNGYGNTFVNVRAFDSVAWSSGGATGDVQTTGIGINSTSTNSAQIKHGYIYSGTGTNIYHSAAYYAGKLTTVGTNNIYKLERTAGGTFTFYGDNGSTHFQTGFNGYAIM